MFLQFNLELGVPITVNTNLISYIEPLSQSDNSCYMVVMSGCQNEADAFVLKETYEEVDKMLREPLLAYDPYNYLNRGCLIADDFHG